MNELLVLLVVPLTFQHGSYHHSLSLIATNYLEIYTAFNDFLSLQVLLHSLSFLFYNFFLSFPSTIVVCSIACIVKKSSSYTQYGFSFCWKIGKKSRNFLSSRTNIKFSTATCRLPFLTKSLCLWEYEMGKLRAFQIERKGKFTVGRIKRDFFN